MSRLSWFSGGAERRQEALTLLEHLIQDISDDQSLLPLKSVLMSYEQELKSGGTAVPYILSRMNIAISHVVIDQKLRLSESQSHQLKTLRELSHIRYGN